MKNLFKKIVLVLITSQALFSCKMALTDRFWNKKLGYERINSFFIDNKEKRIVLIGEAGYDTKKGTSNYSITDKDGKVLKTFEIGLKSESGIYVGLRDADSRGKNVRSHKAWVSFKMTRLSIEEKKFLTNFNESPKKTEGINFGYYFAKNKIAKITRYPSSKETFKNICSSTNTDQNCSPIIKTVKPWQGQIYNHNTVPEFFGKLALTPLTVAVDLVILTPINAVIYFMANKPN